MHKCIPLLPQQNANKNTASLQSALSSWEHLRRSALPQNTAPSNVPWCQFGSNLPSHPCARPAWPYLILASFKYRLQSPCSSLKAFQPAALNVFHIILKWSKTSPEQPEASRTVEVLLQALNASWLGAFYNARQTLPNEGYLQHK